MVNGKWTNAALLFTIYYHQLLANLREGSVMRYDWAGP
jgi:hypothetical protein